MIGSVTRGAEGPSRALLGAAALPAALLLAASPVSAQDAAGEREVPRRPVATYSIVARDPATGELGVAVQSHWFSVGPIVPWAEAGIGAVATQSLVDPAYGPLGLALMRAGKTAPEALQGLIAADEHAGVRQVAMVDARGRVAAHTGEHAIIAAGHEVGHGYSVQANLMEHPSVWPAMARAFEAAEGDLAERMMQALEAAQSEGGDIRGRQSAALLVVSGEPTGKSWVDRVFDLRVEDHPEPLVELRRLLKLARAYREMNAGDDAMAANDVAAAVRHYNAAADAVPESAEMVFWAAVSLAGVGRVDEALPRFERAFAADPRWAVLLPRLPASGLLPDDPALLARILAAEGGAPGLAEWRRLAADGTVRPPGP